MRIIDITNGKEQTITNHTKYFSPDISEDGRTVITVDEEPNTKCTLKLLDASNGKIIRSIPNPNRLFYTYPKFYDSNKVISPVRNNDGKMTLALINIDNGATDYLIPFTYNVIGFPFLLNDTLYFSYSYQKNDELFAQWIEAFGASKFLPGADVLHKKIKIHGWKEETGIDIFHFINEMISKGISQIFCTDISKDGMMQGPATKLYIEILQEFPLLNLIASGGISCFEDLLVLKKAGCSGAIVGKAIYEGKITLKQIEGFLKNK